MWTVMAGMENRMAEIRYPFVQVELADVRLIAVQPAQLATVSDR